MALSPRPAVVLALSIVLSSGCNVIGSAEGAATSWLQSLPDETGDRGWHLLGDDSQARYGYDRESYEADAAAIDWTQVTWSVSDSYEDDGVHWVFVEVDGGWDAVPAFIRERPLAQIWCPDRGFAVLVSLPWLGDADISAGARTGTAERGECP